MKKTQQMIIMMVGDKYRHFSNTPKMRYNGQKVCVNGVIGLHKGVPEMEIRSSRVLR